MPPIQILCSDPAAKAAITKQIEARGYAVDGETIEAKHEETPTRSDTILSCTQRADAKLRDLDTSLIGTLRITGPREKGLKTEQALTRLRLMRLFNSL